MIVNIRIEEFLPMLANHRACTTLNQTLTTHPTQTTFRRIVALNFVITTTKQMATTILAEKPTKTTKATAAATAPKLRLQPIATKSVAGALAAAAAAAVEAAAVAAAETTPAATTTTSATAIHVAPAQVARVATRVAAISAKRRPKVDEDIGIPMGQLVNFQLVQAA